MAPLRVVLPILAVGLLGLIAWRAAPPRVARDAALRPPWGSLAQAMRAPPAAALASMPAVSAPQPAHPPPSRPASPSARPADAPEFLAFYGRLRSDFPRAYAAMVGRTGETPPDAAVWDALRDLEQSEGVLAAQAEPAVLDRFFDARSAVLAGLAPLDAHRCADFLYGATDAGFADFTASHRGLVATLADRTLDAISDGRRSHVERPDPTEADLEAVSASLAAFGLTAAEIGLLIDGTTPDPPLPDRRLCDIGHTYLDVLHGLPPEPRARIYGLAAQLLARS